MGEENEKYLSVRTDFSFSGTDKSYGLLGLIINQEAELIDLGLAVNYEHTAVAEEYINLNLKDQDDLFTELVREREQNYRSQVLKQELINKLTGEEIEKILDLASGDGDGEELITDILTDKLEDIIKESIDLNLYTEFLSIEDLQEYRPDLFSELDDSVNTGEVNLKSALNKDKVSSYSIDEEIELKCNPVVSPVSGVGVNKLSKRDQIVVIVNGSTEEEKEVEKMVTDKNGKVKAEILEVNYRKDVGRYNILLRLRKDIYGRLTVGEGVKIEAEQVGSSGGKNRNQTKNNTSLTLWLFIAVIIILVIGLGILFL